MANIFLTVKNASIEVKKEIIKKINLEYQVFFEENAKAYTVAQMDNNTALMEELKAEREALRLEYNAKMEGIFDAD